MTRAELVSIIRETAGEDIAKMAERIHERRADETHGATDRELEDPQPAAQPRALVRALPPGAIRWFGALAHGVLMGKGDTVKTLAFVKQNYGRTPGLVEDIEKALVAGELVNGGAFIAPEHSDQVIDLLRARTVVRQHIPNTMDVSSGSLDMPRITADATTSWGGEIEEIRESQPSTDQLVMRPYQHKVLVPFSNTFLRRGGPRVADLVRNSTLRSMAIGEDRVFLTSPGSEHRPKGLQYWAPAANRISAQAFTGTNADKLTNATEDLGALLNALEQANVPMTGAFWWMSPRTKNYLFTVRDGNGNFVFNQEMNTGRLWGFPFEVTTSVPNTLGSTGTGTGTSSLLGLTDGDEFMLGQGQSLQVDMTTEGTIIDVDGNVLSLFQRNMSALRVINEVDLKPQHEAATAHLVGVDWTPAS